MDRVQGQIFSSVGKGHFPGSAVRALARSAMALGCCLTQSASADTPPKVSAPQQEEAIVGHLNSTLTWYHQVQESDGWIMQPSDEIYRTTQRELTGQVVVNAFAYARAMAVVIGDEGSAAAKKPGDERALRLTTLEASNSKNLASLNAQQTDLDARIAAASPQDRAAFIAQREVIQAQIELDSALGDALGKAMALSSNSSDAGSVGSFAAQVAALQKAAPARPFRHGVEFRRRQEPSQGDGDPVLGWSLQPRIDSFLLGALPQGHGWAHHAHGRASGSCERAWRIPWRRTCGPRSTRGARRPKAWSR